MEFANTLLEALGIKAITLTKEKVVLEMPVGPSTHQPLGFLHGGASVALAESAASIGGSLNLDSENEAAFGMEINANHLRSKKDGVVRAIAQPIHIGRRTMVWEINIVDEEEELICISRCTLAVKRY
ncbi:hotdog fold thioesterase [Alkalihalobacillus macyae]|uniref:hotdog fold thioesterase n=1 Tax=Guptibacillus hwajinpoensis TaxID=208199 RepID=UPI00273AAD80|nr:hotdog fold thioesterase [Alkalihalobacillus macyae]MDP4551039.1 hotdog fold thioesterase [Alkalihalobacillus macyae]